MIEKARFSGAITRSTSTKQRYLRRVETLLNAAARELRRSEENLDQAVASISPIQLVEWLIRRKPGWTSSTWRQYKASTMYYLEQHLDKDPAYGQALNALMEITSFGCLPRRAGGTSARKAKQIREDHHKRLVLRLRNMRGAWGPRAALMFEASVCAGLRPSEWEQAQLVPGRGLRVKNAKATNGRSNGEYRVIPLAPEEEAVVGRNIKEIASWMQTDGRRFHVYHAMTSLAIYRVVSREFRKMKEQRRRYTLYTARHQFCANMKNLHDPEGVADLMGHGSIETAGHHYGRRSHGWLKYKVQRKRGATPAQAAAGSQE